MTPTLLGLIVVAVLVNLLFYGGLFLAFYRLGQAIDAEVRHRLELEAVPTISPNNLVDRGDLEVRQ